MSRHSRHVIAALQSRDLIQHPPMRGGTLTLGNLSNLAVGTQYLEYARQIQRPCRTRHLLGEAPFELGPLGVNERVADAARGAGRKQRRRRLPITRQRSRTHASTVAEYADNSTSSAAVSSSIR
jgi:hypothetical protein